MFPIRDERLWVGDIQAKSRHSDARKSNKALRRELAELLGRDVRATPKIRAVRKFAGSVGYGLRQLNTLFVQRDTDDVPYGIVHPRCVELRQACERFAGETHDPLKDVLDAGRYVTETAIGRGARVHVSVR